MKKSWWLLFTTALLSVWNAGIIWFTHIAVYPLWPSSARSIFPEYHLAWWHGMWPAFGPVALMFLCSVMLLWWRPTGVSRLLLWLGVLLQLTVHLLTIFFWAPISFMSTPEGMSVMKYQELMSTHWLRVAFFFVYAGLILIVVRFVSHRLQWKV